MTITLHELDAEIREAAMIEAIEIEGHAWDTFRHEDGSATLVMTDTYSYHANPRDWDGNIAHLIQTNSRCIDIDADEAGLHEAHERWSGGAWVGGGYDFEAGEYRHGRRIGSRDEMMARYLSIFRPDVMAYVGDWDAGDSRGWGYVLTQDWVAAMGDDYSGDVTPVSALEAEVDLYRQWVEGEVYGYVHLYPTEPIVTFGPEGAYVSGWAVEQESCWGFLGYDSPSDIAAEANSSPLV